MLYISRCQLSRSTDDSQPNVIDALVKFEEEFGAGSHEPRTSYWKDAIIRHFIQTFDPAKVLSHCEQIIYWLCRSDCHNQALWGLRRLLSSHVSFWKDGRNSLTLEARKLKKTKESEGKSKGESERRSLYLLAHKNTTLFRT